MFVRTTRYLSVALPVLGSAILLFSCGDADKGAAAAEETLMTEYSENLSIVNSQNGRRSYHFVTPLMEGYSQAREPYREFRKGVKITTYQDDSLSSVDGVLTANYAIYYEKRRLWEAKGDVVVEKSDGKKLYTQQLFWNERTKKIYSNVDSKIVQSGGNDVFIGEGFESDEEFKDWRFRRMKGRMEVDVAPSDSVSSGAQNPRSGGRAATPGTASPAAGAGNSGAAASPDRLAPSRVVDVDAPAVKTGAVRKRPAPGASALGAGGSSQAPRETSSASLDARLRPVEKVEKLLPIPAADLSQERVPETRLDRESSEGQDAGTTLLE